MPFVFQDTSDRYSDCAGCFSVSIGSRTCDHKSWFVAFLTSKLLQSDFFSSEIRESPIFDLPVRRPSRPRILHFNALLPKLSVYCRHPDESPPNISTNFAPNIFCEHHLNVAIQREYSPWVLPTLSYFNRVLCNHIQDKVRFDWFLKWKNRLTG